MAITKERQLALTNGLEGKTMTRAEAMKHFGLKETDTIDRKAVRGLLETAEQRAKNPYLSKGMRAELNKEVEAYKALLDD